MKFRQSERKRAASLILSVPGFMILGMGTAERAQGNIKTPAGHVEPRMRQVEIKVSPKSNSDNYG